MSVLKHNVWGYRNRCRCAICTEAWRDYCREYTHRTGRHRPQAQYLAERYSEPPAHGTESRYTGHRCRCDECREAANRARNARRQRTAA